MPATEQYPWPTVWVPFVPASADNGAMQFIPGSHRQPIQQHRKSDGERYATPRRDPAAGRDVVTPELNPGDFVIFSNYVFHRSTAGLDPSVRWSIDFRFSPAGTPVGDHLWFHGMRHVVRSTRRSGPDTELGRSGGAVGAESSAGQESIVGRRGAGGWEGEKRQRRLTRSGRYDLTPTAHRGHPGRPRPAVALSGAMCAPASISPSNRSNRSASVSVTERGKRPSRCRAPGCCGAAVRGRRPRGWFPCRRWDAGLAVGYSRAGAGTRRVP